MGVSWRYGIANLGRRRTESVVQLTAFAHGIMMLLLLAVVRNDLLNDWRRSLPADTPNFFFINIPPDEHQAFAKFLEERGAERTRALPMVRARMTHINGKADRRHASSRRRARRNSPTRDQNITWAEQLGRDNEITEGRWFTPEDSGKPLVSVSTEYAEELNLKLGDKLQFDIAGETQTAKVSSVRDVKWDSFQPNFFLMFAPGLLEGAQGTWMTAAHLDATNPKTIGDLVRRFPSVSVFNVDDLLSQVRSVIDKALAAVQSVFLFTLMAGLVVLVAAVQASREERRYESAMLRTLGANRSTVLKGLLAEFAALGVLSGALAAAGASIAGVYIARRVLQIPYSPDPLGVGVRPRGRRVVSLLRRMAGHAIGGQPAAGAHPAECVMAEEKPRRRSMVGWYDPRVLAHSAYQVAIANIFGRHSDTRLIEALASQPQNEFDYSDGAPAGEISGSTTPPTSATAGIPPTPSRMPSRSPTLDVSIGRRRRANAGGTAAGVRRRRGLSLSVARGIRRAHRDSLQAWRSPAARIPTCSRSRAITTGTTAWSRSRASSAVRSAASPAARRARRAATSR